MPTRKLREFLDDQGIEYVTISHPVAYTAQEIAAVTHISNKEMAKTVVVKIDSTLAMAVLPASYEVDLSLLKAATGARTLSLAKEAEFKDRFPECDIGAIAFNAGSHNELLQVSYADFERLVKLTVLKFAGLPDVESLGAWHL